MVAEVKIGRGGINEGVMFDLSECVISQLKKPISRRNIATEEQGGRRCKDLWFKRPN